VVDDEKCNSCGWCIEACDFGAINIHQVKNIAFICDRCKGRGILQCVIWCPEGALTLVTSDVRSQKARITAVNKLF
jgi:Fe-S-cluster-containing hydrogenase component 2